MKNFIANKKTKDLPELSLKILSILIIIFISTSCGMNDNIEKYEVKQGKDENGRVYEYVTNDPTKTVIYTLENGLKVYLSVNQDEPRIQTLIAVRAGSKEDPAQTTGLAHYLEHMVFKGTSKIGALDWEREKVLLNKISDLYEEHLHEKNADKKKLIYAKIDSVSFEASKYAAANEYDKMVSSIGAKYTNAFTSTDQTVYVNEIPANELEKWLRLESERFGELVLRLFHTELETVYEEFNMGQDNDGRKTYTALLKNLFSPHPYGTQTTIGEAEHLKNPSMINIQNFWNTYYRPNNMAICLSGDLNPSNSIALIEQYFGKLEPNDNIPNLNFKELYPLNGEKTVEVFGPDAASVNIGFRINGYASDDRKLALLLGTLLYNGQGGLIDINLLQKQKALSAYTYPSLMADHGMFMLSAKPKEGQDLEELKNLLISQIEIIKSDTFPDWMMSAAINRLKLNELARRRTNSRAYLLKDAFIYNRPWIEEVSLLDEISKISRTDLVNFTKTKFADNYVVVYKREGKDTNAVKVEKPLITPVNVNRASSAFFTEFKEQPSERLKPVFVNYESDLSRTNTAKQQEVFFIQDPVEELAEFNLIFEYGKADDKIFPLAVDYLAYLGTDSLSPEAFKQELFKLGLLLNVFTTNNQSYLYVYGLSENMDKGIALLSHLLHNAKEADQSVFEEFISDIIKKRSDAKLSKFSIRSALYNYGVYGKNSPITNILSIEELQKLTQDDLMSFINKMKAMKQKVFYFGNQSGKDIASITEKNFPFASSEDGIQSKQYQEVETEKNIVYFVHHDMVQADITLISKSDKYNPALEPLAKLYNSFYGAGLSSIIFQEIREAKGLAYSSYSRFSSPDMAYKSHYLSAFVGTQPDKVKDALNAMLGLLNEMPEAKEQFEAAKESILKQIETERITKDGIFWSYMRNKAKGLDYDIRKDIYETVAAADMSHMKNFFNQYVKEKNFTYLVVGNKNDIDFNVLSQFGTLKELSKEEIFGY